jgi:response regulator RpfG family c-di-GMP phosphodiesterase
MITHPLVSNAMERETILYISDQAASGNSVSAVLRAAGYELVSTNSPTQAIALLFLMRSVAAVVLNQRVMREQTSFDLARSLRAIRPDVLIIMLCLDQVERPPPCADACLNNGQPLEKLTCALRRLLTTKRLRVCTAM